MRAAPLGHAIKFFVCFCDFTRVLLSFEVCVGKEHGKSEYSALEIVERRIEGASLTICAGMILYTGKWYKSVKLIKRLHDTTYNQWLVGTITPTENKYCGNYYIPFLKLSKVSLKNIDRGWFR